MIYFLYIKTHNQTGLKYLGQTQSTNPYQYNGSGTHWLRHIKKYGKDISTELIAAFDTKEDLKVAGLFWSKKWNIVVSKKWANLTEECGDGVSLGTMPWNVGLSKNDARVAKYAQTLSNIKKGCRAWNKGVPNPRSAELGKRTANKQRQTVTGRKIAKREDGSRYWLYPTTN